MPSNCLICSATEIKPLREFAHLDNLTVSLMRCSNCWIEFLNPMPSVESLSAEYDNYFERRGREWRDLKKTYFRRLVGMISNPEAVSSVLEIGAGEGIFAEELQILHPHMQITAIEPYNRELGSAGTLNIVRETFEDWSSRHEQLKFDLIVGLDLIEHIIDPAGFIARLVNIHLNPGGSLFFTTPDITSLSRGLLRDYWPHYKLEHLWYSSPKAFELFEKKHNLARSRLEANIKVLPVGYIVQILSEFGPKLSKVVFQGIKPFLPNGIKNMTLPLPSGELVWMASRRG